MKKNKIFLLAVSMMILSGCSAAEWSSGSPSSSKPPETSITTEAASSASSPDSASIADDYQAKSLGYLEQFQAGDFTAFYQEATEKLKGQLPQEIFTLQMTAVQQMAGKQEEILHTKTASREDGGASVAITARYTLRNVTATFQFDADGKVDGVWMQYQPLEILPESTDTWEEHTIQVGSGEKKLNGMLTLPKGVEKPPVMILVQGSGPSNMDEKVGVGGNRPFADIAHGLAEKGIATIRYDKRTYAYPENSSGNIGIEDEYLNDVASAVSLAAADERVDKDRIYLLGHSEGGMLAPKFALDNPEIKGIVSLAGSLRKLEDIMFDQIKQSLASNTNMTQEQKDAYLQQYEAEIQKIKSLSPEDTTSIILGAPAVYWNSLNAIDSKSIVQGLNIPLLILQGEEDFQVLDDVDYPLWKEALAGKDNVQYTLYPKLNHMFMPNGSKEVVDVTVYDIPSTVDPTVISDIADWIQQLG